MRTPPLLSPTSSIQVSAARASPLRVLFIAWLLLGAAGTLWCFASPLMSVPDEPAHAIKAAAVARGQFGGSSTGIQGEPLTVNVPGYIAHLGEYSCFAQHSNVTPACATPINATDRGWIPARTSAGNYNPVYYVIVGMGSRGLSGEAAVYAMRLISTWMAAFFLAGIFCAASSLRRFHMPVIASAIALTPAVLFLSGSVNPNALEIAATGAVFMSLCAIFEQSAIAARISRLILVVVALSGALLANTRPLSLLWLAIAATAAVLCYGVPTMLRTLTKRGFQIALLIVGLSSLFALWWVVSVKSFESLLTGSEPIPADVAAVSMLDRTFGFIAEYVGVLGWLDTYPPAAVIFTWVLGMGFLLVLGLTARPIRNRWPLAMLSVIVLSVPVALQASASESLGWIWQGRYNLPALVTLLLVCGIAARFLPFRITPWKSSILRWTIVLAVLAHVYLMLEGMRRYTVGIHGDHVNWTEMFEPEWQPPFSWQGLTIAYVVVLAVAGVCLYRMLTARQLPVAKTRTPSRH